MGYASNGPSRSVGEEKKRDSHQPVQKFPYTSLSFLVHNTYHAMLVLLFVLFLLSWQPLPSNSSEFPTETIRKAIEKRRLVDSAKSSNSSFVYSWFPSSSLDDLSLARQQLEASVASINSRYPDIPIHLFTNVNNFSSDRLIVHYVNAPQQSPYLIQTLLDGLNKS